MASITVRALDYNGDPLQGNGQDNFISDLQAVTQIIATRLKLFEGEWFLNLLDGLPLFQSILGSSADPRNLQVILNIISQRISTSAPPYVTSVTNIKASYLNRSFSFSAQVQTVFGTVFVTNTPASLTGF